MTNRSGWRVGYSDKGKDRQTVYLSASDVRLYDSFEACLEACRWADGLSKSMLDYFPVRVEWQ